MAIANMLILLSDITMLLVCMWLYQNGQIGFDGFLIPMIALMSSFGPVTALAALGTTLQSTVASGARVLEIIDEEPETEDITGRALFAVILWNSLLFSNTFISIIYPHKLIQSQILNNYQNVV